MNFPDEYKRYLPVAGLVIAVIAMFTVLVTSGDEKPQPAATEQPAPKKAPPKKAAPTEATGATAGVTPQSKTKVKGAHEDPVPILMYRVTKTAPPNALDPEQFVSKSDFAAQMDWLDENGYTGITMSQLFNYWEDGFELPDKPVVISFDGGYPSHDKVARPILLEHKWPGMLYLRYGNFGDPNSGLLTKNVSSLLAAGWEIGAQTVEQDDLTAIDAATLESELIDARNMAEKRFEVAIEHFGYPAGKYNQAVIAAVENAGFKSAVTDLDGLATPGEPFELKRISISGSDGVDGFATKMRQAQQ